jgi:prephenate dehydrogenase
VSARIGIAGLGLIGGSLLRGLAQAGRDVAGCDADPATAERVAAEGFGTVASVEDLARDSDVLLAAVPPSAAAATVTAALRASPDVVVADATSFKQRIVADVAAAVTPDELARFVPAHPLAGAERRGWDAARGDLLERAFWAVCPAAEDASVAPLCAVAGVLDELDARLIVCTPGDHDDAVARTSHVPHVAAQALVHLVANGDVPLRAALSGGGYRDATRIAESDPSLWAQILTANGAATGAALDALIGELADLREAIDAGDGERIKQAWGEGRDLRQVVERVRWGDPAWSAQSAPAPGWGALLDLGRAGRPVRRLRLSGDGTAIEFDAAG